MIGDTIEVTVVSVKGDKVRIGIKAPNAVAVHRKEVYLAIKEANIEASRIDASALDHVKDFLTAPKAAARAPESRDGTKKE